MRGESAEIINPLLLLNKWKINEEFFAKNYFRYSPPKIEMKYTLMPFIPDYIPAIGDVDAFLKVIPPEPETKDSKLHEFIATLGLDVLDEPCGEQR